MESNGLGYGKENGNYTMFSDYKETNNYRMSLAVCVPWRLVSSGFWGCWLYFPVIFLFMEMSRLPLSKVVQISIWSFQTVSSNQQFVTQVSGIGWGSGFRF